MVRPKIKIELPNWYNLNNYSVTKNNDSASFWFEQLFIRKRCIDLLKIKSFSNHSNFLTALEIIRKNPIVDIHSSLLLKSFFNDKAIHEIKTKTPDHSHGIRLITARDLYKLETRIIKEKRLHARHHFDEAAENSGKGFYSPQHKSESWFNDPLNSLIDIFPHEACLNINLNLTDKALLQQLENILPLLRKKFGIDPNQGKSRRSISTDDLYKYSILPYLDLTTWAYQNNILITRPIIADAIFEQGTRGEDDIKITKKISHQLMRESNLSALATQAALEITKKSK